MRENIFATLPTTDSATQAIGALLDHGVQAEDVSILIKNMPHVNGEETHVRDQAEKGISVTTTDDAAVGAMKGAGIGLGIGTVAAIASVAVPGFGLVLGGGALAAAIGGMAGATAAGAMTGAVHGYLVDQGVEPEHVARLSETVESGGALIGVSYPSGNVNSREIITVFEKYGGTVQPGTNPLAATAGYRETQI
ncbi:MAG: hypothetical protein K8R88_06420 [Armatimonadetes bacterium]|nr:hypothetical protein [Armatimonadota bacterium]